MFKLEDAFNFFCLTGLNGYQSIVENYNSTAKLNSEFIDKILLELNDLGEQPKQIRQDYYNYRKRQNQLRQRTILKKEESIWRENRKRINQLWDKFDSEENRKRKALVYAESRKEMEELEKNRKR